jgi:hypothetical protein
MSYVQHWKILLSYLHSQYIFRIKDQLIDLMYYKLCLCNIYISTVQNKGILIIIITTIIFVV